MASFATGVWRLVVALLLVLGLGIALPGAVDAASIKSVKPTENEGEYRVDAGGFQPNEPISVRLIGPSEQVIKLDRDEASKRGTVRFSFFLPRYSEGGEWTLRLEGVTSEKKEKKTFDVPQRGPNVGLSIDPTEGGGGTTFTIVGGEFDPGERVSVWLSGADGEAIPLGEALANEVGQAAVAFVAPPGMTPGDWFAAAYGIRSDRLGTTYFKVG
jgi:hypothetical protein